MTPDSRDDRDVRALMAVFEALPDAVLICAPDARVLDANAAFLDLVGLDREQVVGTGQPYPWWDPGELPRRVAGGQTFTRIYRRPDGHPVPVEIKDIEVRAADGELLASAGIVSIRSEEHRLEQQLVQSGKLAAIGELAAGVAHEINNPLFAILGLTEFLLAEAEPGSRAHARLELIHETGLEIKEIIQALLAFARENADERHDVELEQVVRQTIDLIRRTNAHKGITIVEHYHSDGALVAGSPNQLKQVVLNLVANARQAMPGGGEIRVEVRREEDHVLAIVSDSGCGIPPEILHRVFEPFFTTKRANGQTGVGLSVCVGIAESHGGSLAVDSEPGNGAVFTLRLPVAQALEDAA